MFPSPLGPLGCDWSLGPAPPDSGLGRGLQTDEVSFSTSLGSPSTTWLAGDGSWAGGSCRQWSPSMDATHISGSQEQEHQLRL